MEFAIETGMRRGELLKLRWEDVNLGRKTALIKETKNGDSRKIPLSVAAIRTLSGLPRHLGGNVFPVTPNALRGVWRRAVKKVGIDNLRFHDLRHEAVSRLVEDGLSDQEVSAISGHMSMQMVKRYTHLRAEDLVERIDLLRKQRQI